MQTFGEFISLLRKQAKLNKSQLAKYSGVSQGAISYIERNKRRPKPETLKKLAPRLGVDYEYLLKKAGYLPEKVSEDKAVFGTKFPNMADGIRLSDEELRVIRALRTAKSESVEKAGRKRFSKERK